MLRGEMIAMPVGETSCSRSIYIQPNRLACPARKVVLAMAEEAVYEELRGCAGLRWEDLRPKSRGLAAAAEPTREA